MPGQGLCLGPSCGLLRPAPCWAQPGAVSRGRSSCVLPPLPDSGVPPTITGVTKRLPFLVTSVEAVPVSRRPTNVRGSGVLGLHPGRGLIVNTCVFVMGFVCDLCPSCLDFLPPKPLPAFAFPAFALDPRPVPGR